MVHQYWPVSKIYCTTNQTSTVSDTIVTPLVSKCVILISHEHSIYQFIDLTIQVSLPNLWVGQSCTKVSPSYQSTCQVARIHHWLVRIKVPTTVPSILQISPTYIFHTRGYLHIHIILELDSFNTQI